MLKTIACCKHTHLQKLLYFGPDEDNIYSMLITEPIGLSLQYLVQRDGPFLSDRVIDVISQVLQALKCVHSLKIIHRDIKPGNIIFGRYDNNYYLIDFGLACLVGEGNNSTNCGTPYFSPAVFKNYPKYSFSDDVQSLLFAAVFLLLGFIPWHADTLLNLAIAKANFFAHYHDIFETIQDYYFDRKLLKCHLEQLKRCETNRS